MDEADDVTALNGGTECRYKAEKSGKPCPESAPGYRTGTGPSFGRIPARFHGNFILLPKTFHLLFAMIFFREDYIL